MFKFQISFKNVDNGFIYHCVGTTSFNVDDLIINCKQSFDDCESFDIISVFYEPLKNEDNESQTS